MVGGTGLGKPMTAEDAGGIVQGQAAPAEAGNANAGEPTDEGAFERVSRDELNRLRSYEQQFRGSKPLVDAAVSSGFRNPDDFASAKAHRERVERYGKLLDTLDQRGVKQDTLLGLLSGGDDGLEDDDAPKALTAKDVERMFEERSRQDAEAKHQELSAREAKMARELVNEVLGDSTLSEFDKKLIADGLALRAFQNRKPYGEDHPLGSDGYLAPHDEDGLKALVKQLREERTKATGEALASKGDAARNPAARRETSPPAGNNAAGKADSGKDDKPFARRSFDEKEAAARRVLQRMQGNAKG